MSGVSDALFGSKGEGEQVVDTTPKPFRDLAKPVANSLRGIIESGGGPTYTGPFTAPFRPEEYDLLSRVTGSAKNTGATQASGNYLGNVLSGQYLQPGSNPFLQATIEAAQRPVLQAFQEVTTPNMRAQFTNAGQTIQGQGSSPFLETQRRAERDLLNTLSDISTNIVGQNFQAERARQQEAAQLAPQVQRQEVDQLIAGLQQQALPRLIEQYGVDQGLAEFQRRINTLLSALNIGVSAANPERGAVRVEGVEPTPGIVQSGLSLGLGSIIGDKF